MIDNYITDKRKVLSKLIEEEEQLKKRLNIVKDTINKYSEDITDYKKLDRIDYFKYQDKLNKINFRIDYKKFKLFEIESKVFRNINDLIFNHLLLIEMRKEEENLIKFNKHILLYINYYKYLKKQLKKYNVNHKEILFSEALKELEVSDIDIRELIEDFDNIEEDADFWEDDF